VTLYIAFDLTCFFVFKLSYLCEMTKITTHDCCRNFSIIKFINSTLNSAVGLELPISLSIFALRSWSFIMATISAISYILKKDAEVVPEMN